MHWVAYNIPAGASGLPRGMARDAEITGIINLEGMINGVNGLGRTGYFGPRPPANGQLHAYHHITKSVSPLKGSKQILRLSEDTLNGLAKALAR